MADNTTELEVLDQIVDVLGGQSGQYETVVPTLQQILTLLGGGGGGGGYNPALSVGRADALTGADSTAQWAQRVTTGSGAATVRSVQGAAVGWNQMCLLADVQDTQFGGTVTRVRSAEMGSVIFNGTAESTGQSQYSTLASNLNIINAHKYYLSKRNDELLFYVNVTGSNNHITSESTIFTAGQDLATAQMVLMVPAAGYTFNNYVCYPQLFDLTQMFGSGNEPATVAEFEQMYPASYYPYSAPTLKPVQIAGIRSTDAQGGELDSVEWDVSAYFPDGMWSTGTYSDALYADRAERNIGVGTITGHGAVTTGTSSKYCSLAGTGVDSYPSSTSLGDKANTFSSLLGPCVNFLGAPSGLTVLRTWNAMYAYAPLSADDSVFDALVGTQVAYLKANTTTTPISPALPMTYKVQQGGSESIIVPDGEVSAAPILTVAEGKDAATVVMDALAAIAAPDGPVATANHSVGTYLTMQGKLYKVTSAIAVGESITPNTNVTETTVMAELIARTA